MPGKIAILILFLLAAAGGGTWWLLSQDPGADPERAPSVAALEQDAPAEPTKELDPEPEQTPEPTTNEEPVLQAPTPEAENAADEDQAKGTAAGDTKLEAAVEPAEDPVPAPAADEAPAETTIEEAGSDDATAQDASDEETAQEENPTDEPPVVEAEASAPSKAATASETEAETASETKAETVAEEGPSADMSETDVAMNDAAMTDAAMTDAAMTDGEATTAELPKATQAVDTNASADPLADDVVVETPAADAMTEGAVGEDTPAPATPAPKETPKETPQEPQQAASAEPATAPTSLVKTASQTSNQAANEDTGQAETKATPEVDVALNESSAVESSGVEAPEAEVPEAETPAATIDDETPAPQQADKQQADVQQAVPNTDLNTLEGLGNLLDSFQISAQDTQTAFGDASLPSQSGDAESNSASNAAASNAGAAATLDKTELAKADTTTPTLPKSEGSFDIIRLDGSGKAVLAGSSNRRATSLLLNGAVVEDLKVSASGQWSYITDEPLPHGSVTFALAARNPATGDFEQPYMAVAALFVEAPQAPADPQPAVPAEPTQLATAEPEPEPAAAPPKAQSAKATSQETETPTSETPVTETPVTETPAAAVAQDAEAETPTPTAGAATSTKLSQEDAAAVQATAEQLVAKADDQHAAPTGQDASGKSQTNGNRVKLLAVSQSAGDTRFRLHSAQFAGNNRDGQLALERLDYDSFGNLVFNGLAQPAHRINVYLNNELIGQPSVRRDQRWHFAPKNFQCPPGGHTIRTDMVDADGQVIARLELPFVREETSWDTLGKVDMTIKRNDNLWRIASRAFGKGAKYTLIYENNNDQISDPNLIYPGQVFEIRRED